MSLGVMSQGLFLSPQRTPPSKAEAVLTGLAGIFPIIPRLSATRRAALAFASSYPMRRVVIAHNGQSLKGVHPTPEAFSDRFLLLD